MFDALEDDGDQERETFDDVPYMLVARERWSTAQRIAA